MRCALCANTEWRVLGKRTYEKSASKASPYTRSRLKILFEIWHPGVETIEISSILCKHCGFVTYSPRPTEENIDSKYKHLGATTSGDVPGSDPEKPHDARSRELFSYIKPWLSGRSKDVRILDYGGGDGVLMKEFVSRGYNCHLVDYRSDSIAGVEKVGDTIGDLPVSARYDVIVASHVLEHVVNPADLLDSLSKHLRSDGIIYIEVPMEIWGKAPLHEEPVTHVNFFTKSSVRYLMQRVRLRVKYCRLGTHIHSTGKRKLVVRAVGRAAESEVVNVPRGTNEVDALLKPTLVKKIVRYILMPSTIYSAIVYKLKSR